MPVSVVVGGQFGSEGKGKVAHFLAKERHARFAIRVGGTNSGHTVIDQSGSAVIFRHLPTACLLPTVVSVIPPGNYLHVPTLLGEIRRIGAEAQRIAVDPYAWVIQDVDVQAELKSGLQGAIGSTATGTGAALVRRIQRSATDSFAKDIPALQPYLRDTTELLTHALREQQRVVLEGTQGFGLSLLHSRLHPYCTSRDTTAAGFVSEAGLSPLDVDEVVLVIRTFPIRVAGASGPLPGEIDWATVTSESGYSTQLVEYTSVTNRVRRVARFDPEIVRRAIAHNRPTCIALNHLDYIDASCASERRLTQEALDFVGTIEVRIDARLSLLGSGPASLTWRDMQIKKTSNERR
jgi:adenylosuccinate synthase